LAIYSPGLGLMGSRRGLFRRGLEGHKFQAPRFNGLKMENFRSDLERRIIEDL